MKIGLNLLQARPAIGGGWKYIASILETIARLDSENEFIAYCTSSSRSIVPAGSKIAIVETTLAEANQFLRLACENTWLQYRAWRDRIDLMHWFGNTQSLVSVVPAVVTMHDLRSFENLREYSPARMLHARLMIPWTVKHARFLLPVSKYTASALEKRLPVPRERVAVVPYPLGNEWRRSSDEAIDKLRARCRLPGRFWLYVAHAYPHKNHRGLFEAYARLLAEAPETWPLILRGEDKGDIKLMQLAAEFGISSHVNCLPPLEDDEMPVLYSAATALVFPSSYEGFGMPLVEALACGCPTVASAIPTTLELAGDRVLTCDPADSASIAGAMKQFQAEPSLLSTYSALGAGIRKEFDPELVFRTLTCCYSRALLSDGQTVTRPV